MSTRLTTNPIRHPLRMLMLSFFAGLVTCVALGHIHAKSEPHGRLDSTVHTPAPSGIGASNDGSSDEAVTTVRPSPVDTSRYDAWQRHRLPSGGADSQIAIRRGQPSLLDLGIRLQI